MRTSLCWLIKTRLQARIIESTWSYILVVFSSLKPLHQPIDPTALLFLHLSPGTLHLYLLTDLHSCYPERDIFLVEEFPLQRADFTFITATYLWKARYSLFVPLNPNQSSNLSGGKLRNQLKTFLFYTGSRNRDLTCRNLRVQQIFELNWFFEPVFQEWCTASTTGGFCTVARHSSWCQVQSQCLNEATSTGMNCILSVACLRFSLAYRMKITKWRASLREHFWKCWCLFVNLSTKTRFAISTICSDVWQKWTSCDYFLTLNNGK